MRKCGFCKKKTNILAQCHILSTSKRTYGRPLEYRLKYPNINTEPEHIEEEITHFITLFLCDNCKNKEYTKCNKKFMPIILIENYFKKES